MNNMPDLSKLTLEQKKEMGLYPKYDVIDRVTGELVTEPVFVLKPETDPSAWAALVRYAQVCSTRGYNRLAHDLIEWTERIGNNIDHPLSKLSRGAAPAHSFDDPKLDDPFDEVDYEDMPARGDTAICSVCEGGIVFADTGEWIHQRSINTAHKMLEYPSHSPRPRDGKFTRARGR